MLIRLPAKIQAARGNSDCPWLLCSGGNPLSPLPRIPCTQWNFEHHVTAASQSQRAQTRTDKQTDKQIHKQTPPLFTPFALIRWRLVTWRPVQGRL
jgi:hypothetical protein